MLFILSLGIWLAVCAVLFVLARSECSWRDVSRGSLLLWGVLLVGSFFVFFRPHENIRAGEDPGVYVNTAARFAQEDSVFFQDKLLAQVPPDVIHFFLFGHRFYGITKDSCFAIRNLESCILGPRFSSLYPVLMSTTCRISGSSASMLYVVPFFSILVGLMLALLVRRLIDHPLVAPLVFFLYSVTPLVVWHGRAARAEVPSSFFIFAGLLFFVRAWQDNRKYSLIDVVLAGCCIAAAPFFHVSAWFVAIPMGVVAVVAALSGRRSFLVYPSIAMAGVIAFIWHADNVADHYSIMRYVKPVLGYSTLIILCVAALYIGLILLSVFSDRLMGKLKQRIVSVFESPVGMALFLRIGLFVIMTGVLVWMYYRTEPIDKRHFSGYEYHYAHPTDMRVVREFLSRFVCLLAILGMGSMILRPGRRVLERTVLFLCLPPAALLMGNIYDIFMTRYMVPVLLPLVVLFLASLVTLIPVRRVGDRVAFFAVVTLIFLALTHHRTQLITVTQSKGMVNLVASLADEIDADNSILLSEYARLGAPFEHLHGIPLLSLDNETRSDYRPAMATWEKIMRENPAKKAYFLTPFSEPVSARFKYTLIRKAEVEFEKLKRDRFTLPRGKKKGRESMALYSMELADKKVPQLPLVRKFDASNMGLWNFSKSRTKEWDIKGRKIEAGKAVKVKIDNAEVVPGSAMFLFFSVGDVEKPAPPKVSLGGDEVLDFVAWKQLTDEWWVQVLSSPAVVSASELNIVSDMDLFLTDIQIEGVGNSFRHSLGAKEKLPDAARTSAFNGRWALAKSGFAGPVPEWEDGYMFMFFMGGGDEGSSSTMRLSRGGVALPERSFPVGVWTWQAWSLRHFRDAPGFATFDMNIDPVYDPGLNNYPHDLGIRVGYIVVLDQIHL